MILSHADSADLGRFNFDSVLNKSAIICLNLFKSAKKIIRENSCNSWQQTHKVKNHFNPFNQWLKKN